MKKCPQLVLANVTLPGGRVADITASDGLVMHIGAAQACDAVVDCAGYLVLPGATDIHVHMRGGSQSGKEDWGTGSRSALAGGVTLVVDQPNTVPPLTTPDRFSARVEDARRHSACHFAINSALTAETAIGQMLGAGVMAFGETFFGPSSYGDAVDTVTLRSAFAKISAMQGLVTIHAETVSGIAGSSLAGHDRARPATGEIEAIHSVQRCNQYGCRLHFCHISTAGAIDAVQNASVEVAPHHLFLSTGFFENPADPIGKVNPPLRTEQERKNLWNRWDRIDIIASDHAPHIIREKQADFHHAPAGIPGVETMMPLLVARVIDRKITAGSVIKKTSENPARIMEIPAAGFACGDRADFAVYGKVPVRIRAEDLHSRCGWTPYEGIPAVFPKTVIMGGTVVYDGGEFSRGSPVWFPGTGYRRP